MRNLPLAQLLLVVLIVVLGLVDLLARSIRKRAGEQPTLPPDVADDYEVVDLEPVPDEPAMPVPSRERERPSRALSPAVEEVAAAAARARALTSRPTTDAERPRLTPSSAMGGRRGARWTKLDAREARRAIVLMEILGPCRGLERAGEPGGSRRGAP